MREIRLHTVFLLILFVFSQLVQAQQEKYKQVLDSISHTYAGMNSCHMKIAMKMSAESLDLGSQTYDLYKKGNEFYVVSGGVEMLFTGSLVLMVIHDQKQMVLRPVTDSEARLIQQIKLPEMDSLYTVQAKQFSEADRYYIYTQLHDKGKILKTVYSYNKRTFLMEKAESFYTDADGYTGQKSVITYQYGPIPVTKNYFNTDKYLVKTKTGYTVSAAYSTYTINFSDPYEK